jgi:SAM-dependent methyltransferase
MVLRFHSAQIILPLTAICLALDLKAGSTNSTGNLEVQARYYTNATHDLDGIGKFYMGREIAQVMGHTAADWLERPERQSEERPDLLLAELKIKPGDCVADIGAGTGYHTRRMAEQVGPSGKVFAVDIQPEMLELLQKQAKAAGLTNVMPVLGTVSDPKLPPASLDLVLMVDVYHELEFPYEMVRQICVSLKPGGRLVLVEFRGEDPKVPIKLLHKMMETQVRKEMGVHPLRWVETGRSLPWQHLVVFERISDLPR